MMMLVIGQSASGKSEYAESRAGETGGRKYYIAAMKPFGEEAEKRIERHRLMREGKGFETIERYVDLEGLCRERPELAGQTVLLECLSNLTANEIFEPEGAGMAAAEERIVRGVQAMSELADQLIVVTADVFGEVPVFPESPDDMTKEYVRILGRVNARLAEMAEEVVEVVYSIPVKQKG